MQHRRLLAAVALLTACTLVLTIGFQIYDTNFYTLWEATALLAGDHPYRDFYEWGAPLQAAVSAGAQWLVGNRLLGEFLVQWLAIIAGAVISFAIALRVSGSVTASVATFALALAVLPTTPTYHYPKLLLYPLGVWVLWRYMDQPGVRRAAVIGVVTSMAFLFRHDHGVYIAGGAALAFALERLVRPSTRSVRAAFLESAVGGGTALLVLAPWLILVQASEGLPEYVMARAQRYQVGSPYKNPYLDLLTMNPLRPLTPEKPPRPAPGIVSFEWEDEVTDASRNELVRAHGLRLVQGPDAKGRLQYQVTNRLDPGLLALQPYVNDANGIDWGQLRDLRLALPPRADALMWLEQVALLVPLLLLVTAVLDAWRRRRLAEPVDLDTYCIVIAAIFLGVVDARLFREPGYVVAVAPLTAALSTRLLVGPRGYRGSPAQRRPWPILRTALAAAFFLVTVVATGVYAKGADVFTPWRLLPGLPDAFSELMASPAIDGYAPREEVFALDPSRWSERDVDAMRVMMRYMHDCTAEGDRVLVTGQTPFQVGYYVERPIAGGQLFWHERWRSDPVREQQSLALLRRQSVPFAFSTHDPVLDDFRPYPHIREHLATYYVELPGSHGLLLIDSRRQPTGTFGSLGFPCFR